MTLLAAVNQYIAWKRAQGIQFLSGAYHLRRFARSIGDGIACHAVRDDQATAFVLGETTSSSYRTCKRSALAGFYSYAITRGLASSSPVPMEALRPTPPIPPYVYSRDELRRLLDAVTTYSKRVNLLEPHTFRALLLLLYGTGLRHAEALALTLADVDLQRALLTVRATKFDKTRYVPFGPQVGQVLAGYLARRNAVGASQEDAAAFFVYRDGAPVRAGTVRAAFSKLRKAAGVSRAGGPRHQPRLHDVRHAFAAHRLLVWYREGQDVQRLLPLLSTYLGHASLVGTQTYLSMTPELLHEAALRFESYAEQDSGGGHA